jgi:DNA-binding response OmpR family regulator
MLAHRGQLIGAERICARLADERHQPLSVQGLRNLIHRLRAKLGRDAIISERDLGYRLP